MVSTAKLKPSRGRAFSGQQEGENVELIIMFHWIIMLPYMSVLLLFFILLIAANIIWWASLIENLGPTLLIFINSMAVTILIHMFFLRLMNYFLRNLLITNYRIVELNATTVLRRDMKNVDFLTMQDIEVSQKGILQRLFNYGNIMVHNATGEQLFCYSFIPRPSRYYNIINHIYRKAQVRKTQDSTSSL